MKITPYLNFNGQCEEAFTLYERVLDGKITFKMKYGEGPMSAEQVPAGMHGKLMHVTLTLGDQLLQGSDVDSTRFEKPQGFSISVNLADTARAEKVFAALADGGKVSMPLQETFWALRFGMVTDRFGISWMVNCEKPRA